MEALGHPCLTHIPSAFRHEVRQALSDRQNNGHVGTDHVVASHVAGMQQGFLQNVLGDFQVFLGPVARRLRQWRSSRQRNADAATTVPGSVPGPWNGVWGHPPCLFLGLVSSNLVHRLVIML